MSKRPTLTVIIPTLGESHRRDSLLRAIRSARAQANVAVRPLVVINGERFDPALRRELEREVDLGVHHQPVASLPLALATGRRLVRTQFFSFLDDDDLYLPDSLHTRLSPLLSDPGIDLVVSNGLVRTEDGSERTLYGDMAGFQADPLLSLMETNWLASCNGAYRTETMGPEIFEGANRYYEWTSIAFRISLLERHIRFIPEQTFVIHETPGSLSRSHAYVEAYPAFIERLIDLAPPERIMKHLRIRRAKALHAASAHLLRKGQRARAWRYHLKSLATVYGITRYALYTRKLLGWPRRG